MVKIENSVIKFGGTSVANESDMIKRIVDVEKPRYVVVSAPGKRNSEDEKVTDMLIRLSNGDKSLQYTQIIDRFCGIGDDSKLKELSEELLLRCNQPKDKERFDNIISFGEWASAKILAPVLGMPFFDSKNFIQVENKRFQRIFCLDSVPPQAVIPGFYGSTLEGKIETMSRGGSDLTGAIIAQAFDLPYHNFTDSAVKVVDPRLIENPVEIKEMTYRELRYLTLSGFSIIHEDVWKLMEDARLPLVVRGTKNYPIDGTLVINERVLDITKPIRGITYQEDFMIITVDSRNISNQGFDRSLYEEFDKYKINISTTSGGLTDTSFLLDKTQSTRNPLTNEKELVLNQQTLNDLIKTFTNNGYVVEIKDNIACIVVVGEELKENRGILGKISSVISDSRNNISFVSQSGCEKSIIYAVRGGSDGKETLQSLYNSFFK